MDPAVAVPAPPAASNFRDGLGERRRIVQASGDTIELLCLRRELTAVPSFEFALRERASRLAGFRHESFARVRGIDRLSEPSASLAVASEFTRGVRLSHLLTPNDKRPILIDINAAQRLVLQILNAVAALHESARDLAHGAIAPERIVVTANARVAIVEYVLGAALEQLRYSPERYWKDLRIALPPVQASAGVAKFDHRADVTQIGAVALSLVLGRRLSDEEEPAALGDVLASAQAIVPRGGREPLSPRLRDWIARALQLDSRRSFASAAEARAAFQEILQAESNAVAPSPRREATASAPVGEPIRLLPDVKQFAEQESKPPAVAAEPSPRVPAAHSAPAPVSAPSIPDLLSFERATIGLEPAPRSKAAQPMFQAATIEPSTSTDEVRDEKESAGSDSTTRWVRPVIAATVVLALAVAGIYAAQRSPAPAATATTGTLSLASNPPGAQVFVDRQSKGETTPVTLTLRPGPHNIELRGIGEPRTVDVNIAAGTQTSQVLDLARSASAALSVTPARTDSAATQADVNVARVKTAAIADAAAVSAPAATTAAPVSGWITVTAPVEVEIRERGSVLGTSHSDRIMVSAGRHQLDIVNDTLGYTATAVVQVAPGKVAPVRIEWPKGTAAVNAEPWAEVWIDGEKVGDTPIGNLSLPIGPHEILFRHPELGEQRQAVSISLKSPARVSVDMRKQP
jgi:serine/threonine protein kinase